MGSFFTHHEPATRTIHFQSSNNPGTSNKVETTKYTWYSFLPKAIILQFIRPANLVYLISAVLQSIRVISSLNPITAIAPFIFVIGISLIREGYEDYVNICCIVVRKDIRKIWRLIIELLIGSLKVCLSTLNGRKF
jgi:hypothetical protein